MQGESHTTVLLHETIDALLLKEGDTVLDGTVGNGGHSRMICDRIKETGRLVCMDQDRRALDVARENLSACSAAITFHETNFRNLDLALEEAGVMKGELDAVIFDLGIRTEQIFSSGRGFSFNHPDEPLLMTFSEVPEDGKTARDALNYWSEETLSDVIFAFGGESKACKIARFIAERRGEKPFERVADLLEVIERAYGGKRAGKIHPATKTFQALRIAVNDEIGALEEALEKSFEWLSGGGRVAVITFHSLEDRVVKRFVKQLEEAGKAEKYTKKPIVPSEEELEANPRSRSAKLRAWTKLENK